MRFPSVLAVALSLALTGPALAEATISVTGEGRVAAAPDMATITLGVTTQAKEADEALRQTSARTGTMIKALREAGIADADLQTSNLSLNPLWKNRSYSSGEAPEIDGFAASNMLSVRVRDLTALGGVLDRVVGLGANSFNGLNFGLVDMQPVQDDARRAAVADALRKAQLYADAAGVSLGPILSIDEAGIQTPRPMMMEAAMRTAADVPIEAGELGITASVTMVFAIGE